MESCFSHYTAAPGSKKLGVFLSLKRLSRTSPLAQDPFDQDDWEAYSKLLALHIAGSFWVYIIVYHPYPHIDGDLLQMQCLERFSVLL